MKTVHEGTKLWRDCSFHELRVKQPISQGDDFMAGILMWLMGVPLVVILLLYLIF